MYVYSIIKITCQITCAKYKSLPFTLVHFFYIIQRTWDFLKQDYNSNYPKSTF